MAQGVGFYVLDDIRRTNKRRAKRTPFNSAKGYFKKQKTRLSFPKITEIQLHAIREKIQKQERKERDRLIIAFLIAVPVTIGLFTAIFTFL